MKIKKNEKKIGGGSGWGGQGGCERRIEGVRWWVGLVGGQGGCERNVGHYVNIPIRFIPQVSPFYIVEKVK